MKFGISLQWTSATGASCGGRSRGFSFFFLGYGPGNAQLPTFLCLSGPSSRGSQKVETRLRLPRCEIPTVDGPTERARRRAAKQRAWLRRVRRRHFPGFFANQLRAHGPAPSPVVCAIRLLHVPLPTAGAYYPRPTGFARLSGPPGTPGLFSSYPTRCGRYGFTIKLANCRTPGSPNRLLFFGNKAPVRCTGTSWFFVPIESQVLSASRAKKNALRLRKTRRGVIGQIGNCLTRRLPTSP